MSDHAELIRRLLDHAELAASLFHMRLANDLRDAASQLAGPAREPQTWQPIATAPKNGTRVLVGRLHDTDIARYMPSSMGPGWWLQSGDRCHPTHWQPLPVGPSPSPTTEPQG